MRGHPHPPTHFDQKCHHFSFILLCCYRNRVALFEHNWITSTNVSDTIYEHQLSLILKENSTEGLSWGLSPNCSLKHQLSEAAEGTGLAFIVFTQAIVSLPGAPFWAVLFFTMLLSLGLGSQIGLLEGMLCTLFDIDIFKRLRKQYVTGKRLFMQLEIHMVWLMWFPCYSYGLPVLFYHRSNILYGCWWILVEDVWFICWYGWFSCDCPFGNGCCDLYLWTWKVSNIANNCAFKQSLNNRHHFMSRFTEDIYQMTGHRPGTYWQWTWRYIGPVIMTCILVSSVVCLAIDKPTYSAYKAEEVNIFRCETVTIRFSINF